MSFRDHVRDRIATAHRSAAWASYLRVRESVLAMLDEADVDREVPSAYWEEELASIGYMLDASPLVVERLREHCHHLTGTRPYEYRRHHAHQREALARKLALLRAADTRGIFVPESPLLGGFGHEIDGQLVNIDTLKFYETLIALNDAGVLGMLELGSGQRPVAVEAGAGWGGFAYQLRTLVPGVCFVVVDLPPVLLFSGTYLLTAFPDAKVAFWSRGREDELFRNFRDYDFVFLPHFCVERLALQDVDVFVNMVSFQEMTEAQIEAYLRAARRMNSRVVYSHNRDRSRHNSQLSSVSGVLARYYAVEKVHVLDMPYTTLVDSRRERLRRRLWRAVRRIFGLPERTSPFEYRHLVAREPRDDARPNR